MSVITAQNRQTKKHENLSLRDIMLVDNIPFNSVKMVCWVTANYAANYP